MGIATPGTTGSVSRDGRLRECAIATVALPFGWVFSNAQTGTAAARVLDQSGVQRRCLNPNHREPIYWDPIWYIRLTSYAC